MNWIQFDELGKPSRICFDIRKFQNEKLKTKNNWKMANMVGIFFLVFCAFMSTGIALGNQENQYEYQTHVELTSEENKNHTGM